MTLKNSIFTFQSYCFAFFLEAKVPLNFSGQLPKSKSSQLYEFIYGQMHSRKLCEIISVSSLQEAFFPPDFGSIFLKFAGLFLAELLRMLLEV